MDDAISREANDVHGLPGDTALIHALPGILSEMNGHSPFPFFASTSGVDTTAEDAAGRQGKVSVRSLQGCDGSRRLERELPAFPRFRTEGQRHWLPAGKASPSRWPSDGA